MKRIGILLGVATLLLSSCVTRIITTAEAPTTVAYTQPATRVVYGSTYVQPTRTTTIVRSSPSKTTTTVVNVTPLGEDVSFFLDLRAVGAAFAAANSLEEFEMLLNSSTYMLSSLDLNHDGYVDYLRVVEAIDGYNHVVVIQAVLAHNIFQDVATLTVEMSYSTPYVQIIGSPYIYGANYYVRPVFVRTPPMFGHWRAPRYNPWRSPYYWDYYPHYYHKPAPVYLSHYQAYVTTYISNNRYCNHCEYDDHVHYADYSRTNREVTRNDYATRHPEESFTQRVASENRSSGSSRTATISNARDLQKRVASNTTTTTTEGSSRTSAVSGSSSSSSRSSSGSSSTSSSSRTGSSSSSSSTSSSSRTSSSSSSSATSSSGRKVAPATTTTTSRVNTNGSATTTTRTVNTDGSSTTTRRGATSSTSRTSSSTSGSSRTSGTSGTSRRSDASGTSGNSGSSRSGNSGSSRTSGTSGSSRTSDNNTQRR